MKLPRRAADPEWNHFLSIAAELRFQTTPDGQCHLLEERASRLLSARVKIWLASPAYTGWGNASPDLLLSQSSPTLAREAFQQRKSVKAFQKPDSLETTAQPEEMPGPPNAFAIPLIAREITLGVLLAHNPERGSFSESDIQLGEVLAFYASTSMESLRHEGLKNWYFEQLNLIRSMAAQIASLPRQDDLFKRVTGLIQETFEFDYVAIFTLSELENEFIFRGCASRELSPALEEGFSVQLGEGIIGTVGDTGVEIVAPDVREHPHYKHLDVLSETRSEAALPLKIENRILGVLDFQSFKTDSFQENDMLVLRALADHIALAIESKLLAQKLERRAEEISSVFEISHAISSILDMDQLLNTVVGLIQKRFEYPFVHVYTVHQGRQLVIYQTGIGERSEAIRIHGQNYRLDAPQGIISWVARNGKTFLSNDVTKEPLFLPSDLPPQDTRSELAVPLIHGEEVLGVLDLQSRSYHAFDEKDRSLFEALAAPISVAMRNASLYRSEQWRRKVAESFRDVAQLISANLPLNQLLGIVLEKLESNLPCDASAIWLLEDGLDSDGTDTRQRLRLAATRNISPETIFEVLQEKIVQEKLENSLSAEQPIIRRMDEAMEPIGAALGFSHHYSSIAAPMRTNNRPLGVITLAHHQDGRYGSEAQAITATFASYAAVAIQNARLYNETQEQALISTMLLQVSEASQTIMTIEDLLATMVRLTRLLVGVRKCAFILREDNQPSFELKSWYGFEPGPETTRLFSPHLSGLAQLISKRGTVYLEDPARELDLPEIYLATGTIVMLPLIVRGNVIGAFLVGLHLALEEEMDSSFDPKALSILQGIAHQTSMTIDNLRLLEARQEEAYVTAALLQVAEAVVSSTDLNDTLDTIVHLLPILVGINTCIIFLWDSTSKLFRPTQVYAQNRREEEIILSRPFAPGDYPLLDAIRQSGEMHLCQITDPGLPFGEWISLPCLLYDQVNFQAGLMQSDWVLGYPLSIQEQVFGVLLARETNTSVSFWERRMEILHGIAQQVSLAIQNDLFKQELVQTERIDREIQLARQIQETFLPDTPPRLDRWEIDLRWQTAREVGGDFYDIIKLDENRIGLVIADVSDKGIPAALYMTVARTLIRANAFGKLTPAEVMQEVNKLLISDSEDAMFITAVYATLTLETGEIIYTNAGHNRPLLYRQKAKTLEQLPKGGTAMGVLEDLKLENYYLTIHPGDSLVLFTDGVTDLLSPEGHFFGDDRLEEVIQQHGNKPVHDMLEALDDAFIEFRRGLAPIDDITLLAVRRDPGRRSPGRNKKRPPAHPEVHP